MSLGRLFGVVVGTGSCLLSGAAFLVLQKIGWKSDGPGALCPMIIFGLFGLIGFASWKAVLFDDPAPPAR